VGKAGIENRVNQLKSGEAPFNASLRLGGLYDSRVGAASSVRTGGQDDTALAATLGAGYQFQTDGRLGFRSDYIVYTDFYQDYDEYNVVDQTVSVEPQYEIGENFLFSLPVTYNYVLEDYETDSDRYSVLPTITYYISQLNQAVAVNGIFAALNDRDDISTDEDGDSAGVGAAYMFSLMKNCLVRASVDYLKTEYDARLVDYMTGSISRDHREDKTTSANLDIQYNFTSNLGIFTSYTYIYADSNVEVYDYDRNIIGAGFLLRY
jgi:hypothetical protein